MTMLPPDPIYIFTGELESISCVTFQITPFVERLFAGTQSGKVHIWSLKTKRETSSFLAGDDTCLSICIPQEDPIITHTKNGNISFWKEDTHWVNIKTLTLDFFGFCKCKLLDSILYAPLKSSKVQLILTKTQEPITTLSLEDEDNQGDIMDFRVCCINNKKVLLIAYEGNKLGLWDAENVKKISDLKLESCPMAVDYDVNTNKGICGDPSEKMFIFSFDKNMEFKLERKVVLTNPGVASVRIRPDGKLVAVGCWDGKLRLYSWKTFVLLAVLDSHSGTVQDVSFCYDLKDEGKGKYLLAAGSQDCRISLWDLYN